MKTGGTQQWHCTNRDCAAPETRNPPYSLAAPRCSCGSWMERTTASVIFSYLDFLRDEEYQAKEYLAKKEQ
jgi:hypothetical protein